MNRFALALGVTLAGTLALTACSEDPSAPATPTVTDTSTRIPVLQVDAALHDALPDEIKASGKLELATYDSQPPWAIPASDPTAFTGASSDMMAAVAAILGVQLERNAVPGLPEIVPGIQAKRFDFALGPIGDSVAAEKNVDFVDWVKERVVFVVPNGNPKGLSNLDTTCGLKIGVIAGGSAGPILQAQSPKCEAAGKAPIEVQEYQQQPQAVLAVQSGRADAYFASRALLTYFVQQSSGGLQLAAEDETNGYPDTFYQGAVFPKGAEQLRDTILKAFEALKANGAYDAILSKWDLDYMSLDEFGINLLGQPT